MATVIQRMQDDQRHNEGFTLIEMMIAVLVLMVVSGTVIKGVMDLTNLHNTIMNRTDMHAGVRNATELLTQEVGQAGRITLPGTVTVTANSAINDTTLTVSSTTGMFAGEYLLVSKASNNANEAQETVTVTAVNSGTQITVPAMGYQHTATAVVTPPGGFAAGVVPSTTANGSTGSTLKIFGDVNSDGNMQYVEYWCDTANGRLYRNAMSFTAAAKPAVTVDKVLIDNILANPDGSPCFTYQTQTANGTTFVTDVAITLTVQTQNVDRNTNTFQRETKALLNVSPRNVFNVWQLATLSITNRVQPTPASVTALLP
jgi:prepilin-type N-terminal cleavage/methylation domain-containing protein